MAITLPLDGLFSRYGIKVQSFLIDYRQSFSRNGAGAMTVIESRIPKWKADFSSALISEDDCLELEAELLALRGALRVFLATDTRRLYPRKGPQSASYSTAKVSSRSLTNNTVALYDLPANLALSRGDKFSIEISGVHYLYSIAEPIVANGAGTTGQFEVTPYLHPSVAGGNAVTLAAPKCSMRIVPGSIQFSPSGNLMGTMSFAAEQI